jgi:hypothetical protein
MITWASEELTRIGKAEELQLASLRRDGTFRNPVTIWVVRVGENLYVRSVNGQAGAWYRGTQVRHAGHIQAGGIVKDVSFVEEADAAINDQIDVEYRAKYRRYSASIVGTILTQEARASTLKLMPR